MLWSDVYATMALAAVRTERIQIGTGVAVAGTRTSAVTAAAHATINRLAPGRVFCAVGTGNTANRVMGAKPMPIAEFERYLVELRGLLDGDETEVAFRGASRPVRHLMPDTGFVGFQPRIPLYVSGFGPRAMALAVGHGDGLVMSIPPTVDGFERAWRRVEAAAEQLGTTVTTDRLPHLHADHDGRARAGRAGRQRPGEGAVRRVCDRRAALPVRAMAGSGPSGATPALRLLGRLRGAGRRRRCRTAPPTSPSGSQLLGHRGRDPVRDAGADRGLVHGRHRRRVW